MYMSMLICEKRFCGNDTTVERTHTWQPAEVCVHVHIHVCMFVWLYMDRIYMYSMHTHISTRTYIYIYTHTNKFTYTQNNMFRCGTCVKRDQKVHEKREERYMRAVRACKVHQNRPIHMRIKRIQTRQNSPKHMQRDAHKYESRHKTLEQATRCA